MKRLAQSVFVVLLASSAFVACSDGGSPGGSAGTSGTAGTGAAGTGAAGTGAAGTGAAGTGAAGTGAAGTGAAGTGAAGTGAGGMAPNEAKGLISPTTGNTLGGKVQFNEKNGIVTMVLDVITGCPAGKHAFHLHANAECGADGNAAGAHWVPKGEGLGEVTCADNKGKVEFVTTTAGYWTIGGAAATDLTKHAVVIHTGDNANPGGRLGCGVPNILSYDGGK